MKNRLFFAIKALVSIGLIAFLLYRMDPAEVWRTIRTANISLVVLSFVLYIGAIALGCLKWQVLLHAQRITVPYRQLITYTFVALFFGNFLPTNVGGDVIRAYDLWRYTDRPAEASISVVVDRLVGLLVFIGSAACLSLLILLFQYDDPMIRQIALMSGGVFAAALVSFLAILSKRVSRKGSFVFSLLPQLTTLRKAAKQVYEALQHYRHSYRALLLAALISLGVQTVTSLVNYIVALSLGLDISFFYFFVFNPLIAFILLVPVSINGIGLQEAGYVYLYSRLAGVASDEQTLSLALAFHFVIILSSLLGGVFWLQRRSLKPKALEVGPEQSDYDPTAVQL